MPDSKNNSLSPLLLKKNVTKQGVLRKNCQLRVQAKTSLQPAPPINKQTPNQAFYNASTGIVLDNQLQNQVANLKPQVLEAKKVALLKQF